MADLISLRRKRGVTKASVTRLANRLLDLEGAIDDDPATIRHAQLMIKKLETLDSEYRTQHFAVVDALEDEDQVAEEQAILDKHDDDVAELTVRLEKLLTPSAPPTLSTTSDSGVVIDRRLRQFQTRLSVVNNAVSKLKGDPSDIHLIHEYQEQLGEFKKELSDIRNDVLTLATDKSEALIAEIEKQDREVFHVSVAVKRLLYHPEPTIDSSHAVPESRGVKLPKIDVPTFSGDLLHWQSFWEQFDIAIHKRTDLSDTEKLVYLRHALKDGSAKPIIEGLSHSGDQYTEAVDSLKSRYNRPRLLHQTHVRKILEAPGLKEGTGKEIRHLHDLVQQHLRALKAMGEEPSGSFITSLLELKLDQNTLFEWQKTSQAEEKVPHYGKLLEFLNLRAQASETCSKEARRIPRNDSRKLAAQGKPITSFTTTTEYSGNCVFCKTEKHHLYSCPVFKTLPHKKMLSVVKSHNLCINCLKPGHISKHCSSSNRCRRCQQAHHSILHREVNSESSIQGGAPPAEEQSTTAITVSSNALTKANSGTLLMTCQLLISTPNGPPVRIRGLLDSGSSASFVSERVAQSLQLKRSTCNVHISGIAGISHHSPLHSITSFEISPISTPLDKIQVTAVVIPSITRDLPVQPVHQHSSWSHLTGLYLSDPKFGQPGKIDILLGVDVYAQVLLQGRRNGPSGAPTAFETKLGWVLAGCTKPQSTNCLDIESHHVTAISADDILRKFWEIEEIPNKDCNYSPEEQAVVRHFAESHTRTKKGRFVVPLPKNQHAKPLGESRSQAVRRFLSLERSLHSKGQFSEFAVVMEEYTKLGHAEVVPTVDLQKPCQETFYLPMHAVRKESSTTTKIRAVFDASAKSSTGVSLNDTLLVGPTVHSPLIDVLLRFRLCRVALTTDVSKMYRAVELAHSDRDLHRFVWRESPDEPLQDFRMTRITFGVSASPFAANMAVKQNAQDYAAEFPLAALAVEKSFYVDDGLTGADSVQEAIALQQQLQTLFDKGDFLLRKWNSSHPEVLSNIPSELKDLQPKQMLPSSEQYTKTLGIEWNATKDFFRLAIADPPPVENITKRGLASDIAKTFDVLGWFSPSTIKAKILLQQLWEQKVDWDDPVPPAIQQAWLQWRSELHVLSQVHIPRFYFHKLSSTTSIELHGFCDASEAAYGAVVYVRATDINTSQITLITSKTKVAPLKRLTIPHLELCGAQLLAHLLHHVRQVLDIPLSRIYAWTDSTIVLNWLDGSPKRFKTYVGNRIASIVDLIPPGKWRHVSSSDNPADCASRGLFPSELLHHTIWWNGPPWLEGPPEMWPTQHSIPANNPSDEAQEIVLHTETTQLEPLIPPNKHSEFNQTKRITAWVLRFVNNSRIMSVSDRLRSGLTAKELQQAELYWVKVIQQSHFAVEINNLSKGQVLPNSSSIITLRPFVDTEGILRVGGRRQLSKIAYLSKHQAIISGKHQITRSIIRAEHLRLLHGGPTLVTASLCLRFHIVGGHRIIRSVLRECLICRRFTARPQPQILGQLPIERITPGTVFDKVGVDYAGPVLIKYGHVRKPTVLKSYVCVFVSLTVKAVHLELVSDLTSEAFLAALKRFIARRGLPSLIWSDNGTNFVGAAKEIKRLYQFVTNQDLQTRVSNYLSSQHIEWKFIPQHAPHFGGIWEAAVKSMKTHLRRIVGETRLTFEELTTVLTQIESCLNSRPLSPLTNDEDGIEALTPGHFLIGKPIKALPDISTEQPMSLLKRWALCKTLVKHFWKRWSTEYISHLSRYTKWKHPTRNIQIGDLVVVREDSLIFNQWPLARVVKVHPGKDNQVRVATIKTPHGTYTRPVTKLALLLPNTEHNNC